MAGARSEAQVSPAAPCSHTSRLKPTASLPGSASSSAADAVPRSADELGVAVGAFTLYPILDIYAGYDSNVFATAAPTTASPVTVWRPTVELRSDWSNHMLRFVGTGAFGF